MRFDIRHAGYREELSSDRDFVVFGRDPSCDIVIRNPRCSRRHASVRAVPGGFHLLDMGSSNGVYVLGQKVDDAIIGEGDVFSMGDVFVRILPEDMPTTIALPRSDVTMVQTSRANEPPRRRLPPSLAADASRAPRTAGALFAPRVLGGSSVVLGLALLMAPLSFGPQIGIMAFVLPILGVFSGVAGFGLLGRFHWSRNVHYALFTLWTFTCLLAPFGVVGFAYQLRGEDRPETDSFFAVVIGVAAVLALLALLVASLLARLYFPAPVPF